MDLKKRKFEDEENNDIDGDNALLEVCQIYCSYTLLTPRPGIQEGSNLEADERV